MVTNDIYLIVCEGDSEVAYVQKLNRYLNEQGKPIVFLSVNAGGGGFSTIRQCCRNRKTQRNGRTFVLADKDVYVRNDNGNGVSYEKEKEIFAAIPVSVMELRGFSPHAFPGTGSGRMARDLGE